MRRRLSRKSEIGVSLFPFLAVLICTMGALIVLLVMVVQQARVQADTITEQRAEEIEQAQVERKQLQQEEEDHLWRQEVLQQQREQLRQKLGDSRLALSHLEDHIRRLDQRWKQLQAEVADMENHHDAREEDIVIARAELIRIATEIEKEKKELDEARKRLSQQTRSYTIIPYDGPNGTRRRPIYIECTEQAITIQPEGIVLTARDFDGPLGPGNPLDAALRTIREYWDRVSGSTRDGEPYPLLIVRPDGAVAYSLARTAMASWDDEFGYELVDADIELEFPGGDTRLKAEVDNAIKVARQRQALLASAMPSRFGGPSPDGFKLDERDLANYETDDEGYGPGGNSPAGRGGDRPGTSSRGTGSSGGYAGDYTGQSPTGSGRGVGTGSPSGSITGGRTGSGLAGGTGQRMQNAEGSEGRSSVGSDFGEAGSGRPGHYGPDSSALAANGTQGQRPGQRPGGSPGGSPGGVPGGTAAAGGTSGGRSGGNSSSVAGGSAGASQDGSCSSGGCSNPSAAGATASSDGHSASVESLAKQKGANWGLPNVAGGSTGITRPISVECYPDRLVILPDRGSGFEPRVYEMKGATRYAITPFVSGVWDHMDRWGMAVAGGYWKPVLRVSVAPGAEVRYADLSILLEDSGIDVEKR